MAKFTINKVVCTVFFIILTFLFFMWLVQQMIDLGLFFGFRLSYVVANDIAGLIKATGGTPGTTVVKYERKDTGEEMPSYTIEIKSKMVCVSSAWGSQKTIIVDCVSHPFNVKKPLTIKKEEAVKEFSLKITKEYSVTNNAVVLDVEKIE